MYPMSNPPAATLLQVHRLHKRYAAPVLEDVDFEVRSGQVHALIGANGAGKTTLSKIICGLVRPDAGEMNLEGTPYQPQGKSDAEAAGVHIVQQELNLIATLSVAENLFLNRLPRRFGVLDRRSLHVSAREALTLVGLEHVDPAVPVSRLGVGQQQLVEIAAALSRRCRLLILDEPTAALTDPQIELLFGHIRRLRETGVGLVYISHRLEELREIADQATVLRDGRVVCCQAMDELTADEMVRQLAGKDVLRESHHRSREFGPVVLRVRDLHRPPAVRGVSFEVRGGEILGLAGLVGSGRTELVRAVFGADRARSGSVELAADETRRRFRSPSEAVAAGVAMIPEDRRQHGLLLSQSVRTNVTLGSLRKYVSPIGRIRASLESEAAREVCDTMQVQRQSLEQRMEHLSGGNQQKVVIARWLLLDSDVYLFDEPTRGIDVAAKAVVYHLLNDLADRGRAVIVVSSELRELMAICDRIAVMSAGQLTAVFQRGAWSQQQIMEAAFRGYSK
jgi:ribose transport system ATP-binding protein